MEKYKRDFELGERLRAMRHRFGETQNEFSRHFPVSRQTYCGWERSGVPPGPTSLMVRMVLRRLYYIHRDHTRKRHAQSKKVS